MRPTGRLWKRASREQPLDEAGATRRAEVADGWTDLRTPAIIGTAVAVGSMSFNFWYPFMPLYLLQIGARSEASALFWIAIATSVQGVTRLLTGPFWGVLSDRMGRKLMLVRALVLATPTTLIAAFIGAPWQISAGVPRRNGSALCRH